MTTKTNPLYDIIPESLFGLGATEEATAKYYLSLVEHIQNVQVAGELIGVPFEQLARHDQSKFSAEEFAPYAMNFQSDEDWSVQFQAAWTHHLNHNEHHWGYWVNPGFIENGEMTYSVTPMPFHFVQEMIADWHGASKSYQDTWDISEWISSNGPKMALHEDTKEAIHQIMHELGYFGTDNAEWGYMLGSESVLKELDEIYRAGQVANEILPYLKGDEEFEEVVGAIADAMF